MKKVLALVLCLALVTVLFAGCSETKTEPNNTQAAQNTQAARNSDAPKTTGAEVAPTDSVKVGLICIGDENDQGYTYNFIRGKDAATQALQAEGINVEWVVKWNVPEGDACEDANRELAAAGCQVIFNNSFGFEDYMLKVAPDYPQVQFVSCTNQVSWNDDLSNTHNAFANIYEGRYLAGVVAGMKLQQLIDEGTIQPKEAVIGYVGAFPFAEVKSGYTAYFLGARSVCPSATMKVQFVNNWSDATAESNAASALCDAGCTLIS
ncbi:MAG: BMP family ABC transporter substrate-binding protein, partial [Oscillospiraceae bacterium]|nr:BMP family ABC transporter substrate-binding protein [Oscillospiraceae bacterium]